MIDLSDEQRAVFRQACAFASAKHVGRPYFLYEGLAGVGKTVVLAALARRYPSAVLCSPFGKAAANLARKTGLKTYTCHSAIYRFRGRDQEGQLRFDPKVEDRAWRGRIVLLDESGVAGKRLGTDLIATGCRVIACGDPGQLPPVNDTAFFHGADATLREVHRQAWNSPIIRQAHRVRNEGIYEADGPDFRVQATCSQDDVVEADAVLCWTNATRRSLNTLKRAYLGLAGKPPQAGEPVMALRNDHRAGILNGAVYEMIEDHVPGRGIVTVVNERGNETELDEAWIEDFEAPRVDTEDSQSHPFAMGYVMTTHKAIGGEFDFVLLVDEMPHDREEWSRWAYCGITRAAKRMLVKT
jgi:Mesyanzhinovviridae Dda-like helicase